MFKAKGVGCSSTGSEGRRDVLDMANDDKNGLHGVSYSGHSRPILATLAEYGQSPGVTLSRSPWRRGTGFRTNRLSGALSFCSLQRCTNSTTLRTSPILASRVQYIYRLRVLPLCQ